jgi:hypothetical protein
MALLVIGLWLSNSSMMTEYTFVRRLIRIWRDFDERPSSKFRELPPTPLLRSSNIHDADVDSSELSRAEWFWRRRPRLILGEGLFGWPLVYQMFLASYRVYSSAVSTLTPPNASVYSATKARRSFKSSASEIPVASPALPYPPQIARRLVHKPARTLVMYNNV